MLVLVNLHDVKPPEIFHFKMTSHYASLFTDPTSAAGVITHELGELLQLCDASAIGPSSKMHPETGADGEKERKIMRRKANARTYDGGPALMTWKPKRCS